MPETQTQATAQPAAVDHVTMDAVLKETQRKLMERPELLQMRMENETMMAECRVRPRNHESIKAELIEQLRAYPSFARDAIYNKPVGRDEHGVMKFARNLSIRAAEAIAEAYGYCRIRSDVTVVDEDTVRIEASFIDYQKCRCWQDAGLLSKFYKTKQGRIARIPDDRFFNLVVKAEVSKRIREVITRSVPPGLRSELFEMAERQIDELLDDKTMDKILGQFSSKGVTLDQIETHIGRTRKAGWTKGDRRNLLGVWNAIKDGETTVAEAFEDGADPEGDALAAQLRAKAAKTRKSAVKVGVDPAVPGSDKSVKQVVEVSAEQEPAETPQQPTANTEEPSAEKDPVFNEQYQKELRSDFLRDLKEVDTKAGVEEFRLNAENLREDGTISGVTLHKCLGFCAERIAELAKESPK